MAFAYVVIGDRFQVAYDGDNGVWRGNIGRVYADLRHNADGKGYGYDCGLIQEVQIIKRTDMKWRSIESAAKDRPVWLLVESEMHIYTGQHNENGWFYIFREKGEFAYDGFHGGESSYAEVEPTHWCEIPESISAVL